MGSPRWLGTVKGVVDGRSGRLELVVRDAETSQPLPCRVNVVGRDGHYYHPPPNRLSCLAITDKWSHSANMGGNRIGKPPYRYLGRFFYILGETSLAVPDGAARIEIWRGYEYRPETIDVQIPAGGVKRVETKLTRAAPMAAAGYYAGDTHLRTVKNMKVAPAESKGRWIGLQHAIEVTESCWVAVRAHSKSPGGQPDAEAHTNPVYVYLNNRAPFDKAAIESWIAKVDGQIAIHADRVFPDSAKVMSYILQSGAGGPGKDSGSRRLGSRCRPGKTDAAMNAYSRRRFVREATVSALGLGLVPYARAQDGEPSYAERFPDMLILSLARQANRLDHTRWRTQRAHSPDIPVQDAL